MASIANDPNGRRRVLFFSPQGKRKTIRLGLVSAVEARDVAEHVDHLSRAVARGGQIAPATFDWLAEIPDELHAKLARHGLTEPRAAATLGGWLDLYIAEKEYDLKPESVKKLRQTAALLKEYLNPTLGLRAVSVDQAAAWVRWMRQDRGLSQGTVGTHVGNARDFFNAAERRGLVKQSPFRHTKPEKKAEQNPYINRETIEKVIAVCPSAEWRVWLALARYAGLRSPSETHCLT